MKVLIFEDGFCDGLGAPALLRPAFEILCGAGSLLDRLTGPGAARPFFRVRERIAGLARERYPGRVNEPAVFGEDLCLVNARLLSCRLPDDFPGPCLDAAGEGGREIAFAAVPAGQARAWWRGDFGDFLARVRDGCPERREAPPALLRAPWEIVGFNPETLLADLQGRSAGPGAAEPPPGISLLGPAGSLDIAPGARVEPGAVFDTTAGPVRLEEGALVSSFCRVSGPCRVGPGTRLMPGTRVGPGCSFGPGCRLGGEIEASVVQGWTNKYHDGFLGHSYLGEFVNLGAGTVTGDLRNDYVPVRFSDGRQVRDTGLLKLGAVLGDFTRTSIGTLFDAGTHAGASCRVMACGGLQPRFIPSFAFCVGGEVRPGKGLEHALETARRAMGRREFELTPGLAAALEALAREPGRP